MRLQGKTAIVTGATQGIGRGIARRFAAEGAVVVLAGRNEHNGRVVENEIRSLGGEALYIRTDVSVSDDAENLVRRALEAFGRLDVLVNNAGVNMAKGTPFYALTLEEWCATIETNLTGTFLCSRAAARPMMERRQGKIINIGSVHSFSTASGNAAYTASKGGIIQLTKAMAIDLSPFGITVNAVAPGAIAIEREPGDVTHPFYKHVLLGRPGTVEEVASLCVYLASDESSYVNGAAFTVDGGLMALLPGKLIGEP